MHRKIKRLEPRWTLHNIKITGHIKRILNKEQQTNASASDEINYVLKMKLRRIAAETHQNIERPAKRRHEWLKCSQTAEKPKSWKRGLFHSPIFHITCIIRNVCYQKIRPPFSSDFESGGHKLLDAVSSRVISFFLFW